MKKFKRVDPVKRSSCIEDAIGKVQVIVHLRWDSQCTKYNITRSLTIEDARVGEVFTAIVDTLIEEH